MNARIQDGMVEVSLSLRCPMENCNCKDPSMNLDVLQQYIQDLI
jgi:hypothetical protein